MPLTTSGAPIYKAGASSQVRTTAKDQCCELSSPSITLLATTLHTNNASTSTVPALSPTASRMASLLENLKLIFRSPGARKVSPSADDGSRRSARPAAANAPRKEPAPSSSRPESSPVRPKFKPRPLSDFFESDGLYGTGPGISRL